MEGNNQNVCEVCGSGNGRCGKCGNMCGFGGKHILRWILGIIIITWVFCIGMKFGELKAGLDRYYYGYSSRSVMPMMYGAQGAWDSGEGNVTFTSAVPATPVQGSMMKSGTVQIIKSN